MPEVTWKNKIMIVGTVVGALIGLGTALLIARSAEKNPEGELPEVSAGEALGIAISIIGVVRGIAALADEGKKPKKK